MDLNIKDREIICTNGLEIAPMLNDCTHCKNSSGLWSKCGRARWLGRKMDFYACEGFTCEAFVQQGAE